MTAANEPLGPEHGSWQGWPAGAKALFESVFDQQMQMWRAAGSPKHSPNRVMDPIDEVVYEAWRSYFARELAAVDPHILASLGSELRSYQPQVGMLPSEDMVAALRAAKTLPAGWTSSKPPFQPCAPSALIRTSR
jgi:hypothetical protein